MNIQNCPICGMRPEVHLYSQTLTDQYYIKISCKYSKCRIKPSFRVATNGGWPDDLSFIFNEWEYKAREHAKKEGLKL